MGCVLRPHFGQRSCVHCSTWFYLEAHVQGFKSNQLRSWIRFWTRRLPFAGKAAFRRKAATGNRGPTLKQPRCKLNLRDQRRAHCLSCFAVFQARGAEGVTNPRGAEGSPTLALQLLLWEQRLSVKLW